MTQDTDPDTDEWFTARKRPLAVEARGPYTGPDVVETLEGDFEVDQEYIDEHGGYYIIRGVEGEIYPCGADIFEQTYTVDDSPSPIVHLSDGPRLILADGAVVRPLVTDLDDGTELAFIGRSQGASMYGETLGVNETASIAYVDDPDAAEHDVVQERREQLGVE